MEEQDLLQSISVDSDKESGGISLLNINRNNVDQTKVLLMAALDNNQQQIQDIVANISLNALQYKYSNYCNRSILLIACTESCINKNTLDTLCKTIVKLNGRLDLDDQNWYGWEPLHYVAEIANAQKLKVLLKYQTANSLTIFSENPLHILLNQSMQSVPSLLYDGSKGISCLIIDKEKVNITQCARILIEHGINVNHKNFWNESCIALAARYRYSSVIKLLLRIIYIDLDKTLECGKVIREYLTENNICTSKELPQIQCPDSHYDPVIILFDYLKSGDEDAFVAYNNGNIKDYVNVFDGGSGYMKILSLLTGNPNSTCGTCGTMLQLCFRKGFMEYLNDDLCNQRITTTNIYDSPMLNIFITKGFKRCIEHLLENDADPLLTDEKCKDSVLEAASLRGYYPLVTLLLEHKTSKITSEEIFNILPKLYSYNFNLINHDIYRLHVLSILINKLVILQGANRLTSEKHQILQGILYHLNLNLDENNTDDSKVICQILSLGTPLTTKDNRGLTIIERIHPNVLQCHYDNCIDNNVYHYNTVIEDYQGSYSETKTIDILLHSSTKKHLICHPLFIYFIHNKWLKIRWFFYLNLLFYCFYLIFLYLYLIYRHNGFYNIFINITLYVLLIFQFIKEIFQLLIVYHWKYFCDISNYIEIVMLVLTVLTIILSNVYTMIVAILLSSTIFSLMLGQLPQFAKYTIIFNSTRYFLQYVGFYSIQFIAFSLCFYLIFPFENKSNTNNILDDLFKNLFYTLIQFTGEFKDRVLDPSSYPFFGRLLTAGFIFIMTIIINNLLVGLIVSDIDEIQKEGKFYKHANAAQFIIRTNYLLKRLHDYESFGFIKAIAEYLNVFQAGNEKNINLNECVHHRMFDSEDRAYIKELNKRDLLNKNISKNVYRIIKHVSKSDKIKTY